MAVLALVQPQRNHMTTPAHYGGLGITPKVLGYPNAMLPKHDTRKTVHDTRSSPSETAFSNRQGCDNTVVFLRQTDLRIGGRILIAAADHQHRAAKQLIPHNGGIFTAFHGIFQHQILAVLQFGAYRQVAQQVHLAAVIAEMLRGCALTGADKSPKVVSFSCFLSEFRGVNQI